VDLFQSNPKVKGTCFPSIFSISLSISSSSVPTILLFAPLLHYLRSCHHSFKSLSLYNHPLFSLFFYSALALIIFILSSFAVSFSLLLCPPYTHPSIPPSIQPSLHILILSSILACLPLCPLMCLSLAVASFSSSFHTTTNTYT